MGAAVDCNHDIWSETIVRAFTNMCLYSGNSIHLHVTVHIVGELHLESVGPLRVTANEPGTGKYQQMLVGTTIDG